MAFQLALCVCSLVFISGTAVEVSLLRHEVASGGADKSGMDFGPYGSSSSYGSVPDKCGGHGFKAKGSTSGQFYCPPIGTPANECTNSAWGSGRNFYKCEWDNAKEQCAQSSEACTCGVFDEWSGECY